MLVRVAWVPECHGACHIVGNVLSAVLMCGSSKWWPYLSHADDERDDDEITVTTATDVEDTDANKLQVCFDALWQDNRLACGGALALVVAESILFWSFGAEP
jgi:hypothetical protein